MSFNLLLTCCSLVEILKCLSKIRISSCIIWPWCISSFNINVLVNFTTLSLLFQADVNLFLNLLLTCLDFSLNISNFLLGLVLFQFKHSLFFNSIKMLFLNFLNFFFIIFVKVLQLFDVLRNGDLFTVDSVLVGFMEISFFS